jgi:serine/threonine protein kinase
MNCPTCNTRNDDSARFCSSCGGGLAGSAAAPPSMKVGNLPTAVGFAPAIEPQDEEVTQHGTADPNRQASGAAASSAPASSAKLKGYAADQLLGQTIDGKYRIDEKIGVGGMGAVYRAARLRIGDEVAIKILHPVHVLESEAIERFQREAQAEARLKHPNAVFIIDFGITTEGLVYLVMELVHGVSLRALIKQQGPIEAPVVAEILNQVCSALDEAHRLQIVHRDLKPDNILVQTRIDGLRVKVLDFGIAKLRDLAASTLTLTDRMLGSPRYMSPEQCLGEEIDSRSDIYSLGIVLYEMLTGDVPFKRPSSTAVVNQQVTEVPPALRRVNPAISESVEAVVAQALEKSREARPQSARALAAAFNEAVNAPVVAEPKRPQTVPPAGMDVTEVMPKPRPFSHATTPVQQNKKNNLPIPLIVVGAIALLAVGALLAVLLLNSNGRSTNNNNAASPQPTVNTASVATPLPIIAREPTPPNAIANLPTPSPTRAPIPSSLPYQFQRTYVGTINGKRFDMTLRKQGSTLEGSISTSNFDALSGQIDSQGRFSLSGQKDGVGRPTGIYNGQIHNDGTISGTWSSTQGKGSNIPFSGREN